MTDAQFKQFLDTFGSDFSRWPSEARQDAEALLAGSVTVRDSWEKARRLDRVLQLDRDDPISPARIQTIRRDALRKIRQQDSAAPVWRWLFTKPVGAAFASAAFAGLLVGFVAVPLFNPPHPPGVSAVAFLLNGGGLGSEEIF